MENSVFKRFPAELISEVFQHCLPEKPSFSPVKAPLVLTQVCHAWRTIALDSPRIWTRFAVPDWQELPQNVGELVKLWVERSGDTPLDIDIRLFNEDVMVFPDSDTLEDLHNMLGELLAFLGPRRARIQRFRGVFPEFLMPDVGVAEMVNAEYIYYCGMLGDSIALQGMRDDEIQLLQIKLDLGPPRESLRSLAICGCAADIEPIKLQTQLTHLELLDLHRGGDLCQETAFAIMQSLPNLKTCIMDLTRYERQDWTSPSERIVLNNMELLFLSWVFPADVDSLLGSISAPKLTKLGLRGTPMVAQRPWNGLHDFLDASKAPIQRISLGDFGSVDAQLLRCFSLCPELVHLTMNHCEIPDVVFRTLTCTDALWDTRLLPNLQIFNMGVCEGFVLESVLNFLKSRAKDAPEGVMKLAEAAIMYCMKITESHAPLLKECGVENLILEAAEDDSAYPYARVVETHRELLAMLYQNDEDELPPFPDSDDEGWEEGREEDNGNGEVDLEDSTGEDSR